MRNSYHRGEKRSFQVILLATNSETFSVLKFLALAAYYLFYTIPISLTPNEIYVNDSGKLILKTISCIYV